MPEGEVRLIFTAQGTDVVTAAMQLMMDTASKLRATLRQVGGSDITKPMQDLGTAFRAGADAAQSMGGVVQVASGALEAMKTPLGAAAAGIGAMATVMTHATAVAEETFRSIRSLSAVTGQSVEATKELEEAFKLMGLGTESMERAMFRLSMEIETGGKRLAAYGISVRDVQGHLRPTGEVFEDIVRKVGAIGDASQRNAVLLQLFGRAGRELAPLFAAGGTSLDQFKEKARELGIYSQEDYAQTQELIQAKAKLSEQMEHLWLSIAKAAIPVVEGFVKVAGFLVEAITAVLGLAGAWIKWMATSKEAVDPLSLSVKALAAAIMAVGKAVEYVQRFGKFVADLLVAPVGKPGGKPEEKKAESAGAPIVTSDDVTFQAKLREEQMKLEQRFFQERSRMQTGSQVEGLRSQQEYLAATLALERKKVADLMALTDDPVQKEKLTRELKMKEVQIEGEKNLLVLKIREQEAADAKRLMEDQLKARKDAADEEVKIIQLHREEDIAQAERGQLNARDLAERRKDIETNAARDTAKVKLGLISEEMDKLQTLAKEYTDNAAMQRDIQNRMIALAHERAGVEISETEAVDRARDQAAKAEEARKEKEAGMFGQMIKQAEEYAKAQGRAYVTQADILASQQKLAQQSQQVLGSFFGGGAVDPSKLSQAYQFAQQQRGMQQIGATPETITSAAFGQVGQTFGAGFGYEAATAAYQRGDVGMGNLLRQRADIMGAAEVGKEPGIADKLKIDIDPKIAKLKTELDGALTEVTGKWGELVATIPEKITRWLEAEAARN